MTDTTPPTTWADLDAANKADGHYTRKRRPDWLNEALQGEAAAWQAVIDNASNYEDGKIGAEAFYVASRILTQQAIDAQAWAQDCWRHYDAGTIPASEQFRIEAEQKAEAL